MRRAISSRALQVPVSPPTFDRGPLRHCLSRLNLADMFIQALTASAAHPSPVTDENDAPEQVALDHQGVEAGHVLLRLNPPQNEGVLDGRTLIHIALPCAPRGKVSRLIPRRLGGQWPNAGPHAQPFAPSPERLLALPSRPLHEPLGPGAVPLGPGA